jgi:hypothetical protein
MIYMKSDKERESKIASSHSPVNNARVDSSQPAALSDGVHRMLNAYALAAGAAGVAALACSPQAEAAPVCKTASMSLLGNETVRFNPANEQFPPFQIAQTTFAFYSSGYAHLFSWKRGFFTPNSLGANLLLGAGNAPANVAQGASIGPGGNFGKAKSYGLLFTYGVGTPYSRHDGTLQKHQGNLSLGQTNIVGVQFSHNGQVHYGWARLLVTLKKAHIKQTTEINVLGWGYESTPNTAIAAGSCTGAADSSGSENMKSSVNAGGTSLGVLALGSAGLAASK